MKKIKFFALMVLILSVLSLAALKIEGNKVVFTFNYPQANTVHLAGTFNNWSTNANPMRREGDLWVTELELKPGTYQYKFVIDGGKVWKEDPDAPGYTDDGFGGKNGVFTLALKDDQLVIVAPATEIKEKVEINTEREENFYIEDNTYVVIRFYKPEARYVFIAGSFNNWSMNDTECYSSGDGWWEAVLELTPGVYQYKFVVDGKDWLFDPNAPAFVDDGFGGKNGIFEVWKEDGQLKVGAPRVKQEEEPAKVELPKENTVKSVEYEIDGKLSEKEKSTAIFTGSTLKEIYVARTSTAAYVAVVLDKPARDYVGQNVLFEVYTDAPKMTASNRKTSGGTILSKPVGFRFSLNMRTWQTRKRGTFFAAAGDDSWILQANVFKSAVDDVVEIEIPYDILGIKSGENFNIYIVCSVDGKDEVLPQEGIAIKTPTMLSGNVIAKFADKIGDDYGFGTYVYPKDPAFAPYKGLWDITEVTVLENDEAYVFSIKFAEMTNPWASPKGFSHQLVNIYLDTKAGGKTSTYKEGARVQFKEPWDYFIKVAGWPDDRIVFATADGKEIPEAIIYEADPADKVIHIIVFKKYLEVKTGIKAYILSLSQDGYGTDHIRPVSKDPTQWTLGGYPVDSKDFAPYVLDTIVPEGQKQEDILKSYVPGQSYATLIPIVVK
ncbi:glucodextranase DOMON-like domain-containing protein [Fervidobacterium nodosum]|uniref:Glycoside hydrolase family 13 domain protein n=1 Tax=Fervidobacterium nodosum (strain ATCC 35602 / DSM 5306 / Rt17-B1) TaxID=381764 RepID=A7HNH3_FERNB|nr:glucodextranase DOMON-like domain-containing protein [Fervidobacterium nodosum]ABS61456.1 glycoside hydrolase family 13 domain protein [Fervidobacterium nodosum Rt17-B1]PHJ13588.1 glycoside hydrolase family 13 [Fervidobacterium sp. SC_NGM5_G05]